MFVYISCIVGTSACFTYSYLWNVDVLRVKVLVRTSVTHLTVP